MMIGGEKMELANIVAVVTIFITWIFGVIAKNQHG